MSDFFRFPHIPHLAWLGQSEPRGDKVLSPAEAHSLLSGTLVVEEKLDGANLGLLLAGRGGIRAQNRGQYLQEPYAGQFARLQAWLAQHESGLLKVLTPDLMLFGEWCAARHSLGYATLPDWFLLFDVYDRTDGCFWSTPRRNQLANEAGLNVVPTVFRGHTTLTGLTDTLQQTPSQYRGGQPLEGVVVRQESDKCCQARAKLVRPDFIQAIDGHWRKRGIEWNRVKY